MSSPDQARQFAYSFSLLVIPTLAGYLLRKRMRDAMALARRIQVVNMLTLTPAICALAAWILKPNWNLIALPGIGVGISAVLLMLSLGLARLRKLPPKQLGSFTVCGATANIGTTLGGFLCYLLMDEAAFSLSIVYHLYFFWFFFLVCFPLARSCGSEAGQERPGFSSIVLGAMKDPRSAIPLLGLVAGFALLFSGYPRPEALASVQAVLVPVSTALAMFGLGLTFRFSKISGYARECRDMCLLKFVVTPLLALAAVKLLGLDGEAAWVVLVLSTMPTAIYACLTATLFDNDVDLANSAFLVTTAVFIVVVLPILVLTV